MPTPVTIAIAPGSARAQPFGIAASRWCQLSTSAAAAASATSRPMATQATQRSAAPLGAAAPVAHAQVVLPVAGRFRELPLALENVRPERGREALVEPGVVAPHAQHACVERDAVCPAHAARVEVLHEQPVAGLGGTDDADRVGEQPVGVAGALNQEAAALQPFEGDAPWHDPVDQWMGRLGVPGTDQRVEGLKHGISVSHAPGTIAPA